MLLTVVMREGRVRARQEIQVPIEVLRGGHGSYPLWVIGKRKTYKGILLKEKQQTKTKERSRMG
jgi:hypothetical protein